LLNVIIAKKSLSSPVVLIFEEGNEYVYYDYIGIENLSFRRMLLPRIVVEMDSDIRNTEDKEILTMFKDLDLIFYNSIISSQNDQYLEENDNLINYSASYQFQKSINKKLLKSIFKSLKRKKDSSESLKKCLIYLRYMKKSVSRGK
jgi:hypothetical protein